MYLPTDVGDHASQLCTLSYVSNFSLWGIGLDESIDRHAVNLGLWAWNRIQAVISHSLIFYTVLRSACIVLKSLVGEVRCTQ